MKKKLEQRVEQNEQKYRALAEKFVDIVWVVNAETMTYLYVSENILNLTGYTPDELIGKSIKKRITTESFAKIQYSMKEALVEFQKGLNKSYNIEIEIFHKNGSTVWWEISAKLVQEQDEPLKIVGIARNITQRKTFEKDRETFIQRLEDALTQKNELLEKIKVLESLLPICSGCRRIRDADNHWWPIEKYVEEHAGSKFTHTICQDCSDVYYQESKSPARKGHGKN